MRMLSRSFTLMLCVLSLTGCRTVPGKPAPGSEAKRPDQVLDFDTLYQENCSACHGEHGRRGAAIPLANPAYLAFAGAANLQRITANGVPGTLMPPFRQASGGMLTDQQIAVITQGMIAHWSSPSPLAAASSIRYAATLPGDPARGGQIFAMTCSRCHGADGTGSSTPSPHTGSLVDPAYLALISDQGLRSIIVAGLPGEDMPGADSAAAQPMADQDVTDIVAWLTAHRTLTPGQPYATPAVPQRRPQ